MSEPILLIARTSFLDLFLFAAAAFFSRPVLPELHFVIVFFRALVLGSG